MSAYGLLNVDICICIGGGGWGGWGGGGESRRDSGKRTGWGGWGGVVVNVESFHLIPTVMRI